MSVILGVGKILFQSLLFLFTRLPPSVFFFITRLFGIMYTFWNPGRQNSYSFLQNDEEEYDSTWEDDNDPEETREPLIQRSPNAYRNKYAARDMQTYRQECKNIPQNDRIYDDMEDDNELPNLKFYQMSIPSDPDGVYIEEFHKYWFGDYDSLEYVHSYIQWLFPILEKGMNIASHKLSLIEVMLFRTDEEIKKRLLTSYKLMLDFYGIELVNEKTGEVQRARNWKERSDNLNRNTHNNLRITRIIKCLGLLGFDHYQAPLVHFFLEEALVKGTLPRVKQSVLDYFMFAVLDKSERKKLIKFAFCNFEPKEQFVWCPIRICNKFLKEEGTVSPSQAVSSDSVSQSDQNDLTTNRVQYINEIKTDTNESTSNEKSLSSQNGNDGKESDECQDSEKRALPVTAAGNANSSDTNEGIEVPSGVDSPHGGHIDSEDKAAIQKEDSVKEKSDDNDSEHPDSPQQSKLLNGDENFDNSTASDENTNEILTQPSNHSSDHSVSGGNSGSEQQDHENQGDKSEQEDQDDLKSQHTDKESKEYDSEEAQKSGNESSEDSGRSAHSDGEKSEVNHSHKYTSSPGEANASGRSIEQTSDHNLVSSKMILTPGSDRDVEDKNQESDQVDELPNEQAMANLRLTRQPNMSKCDLTHHAVKGKTNTKEQTNEKNKDPVPQSTEDNSKDTLTDEEHVSKADTSHNNDNSDSTCAKNGEYPECPGVMALGSHVNKSQVIPAEDTDTGESSKEKSVEDEKAESGCVRDGGTEKEENIPTLSNI